MTFAYDYPLLGLFWTLLWFYLVVAFLFLLFHAMVHILRRTDLSGVAKAAWLLFILVLPFLGVLVYLAAGNGDGEIGSFRDRRPGMDDYRPSGL
jgi:hypothetical protein